MAIDEAAMVDPRVLARMATQFEVEQFYYEEAALLDAHKYSDWIELFSEDTHYFMPIRRTRTRRELDKEFTKPGEMAYFDDDKMLLNGRVLKFNSGTSWAEDPPSRTRHMVHNVRVVDDRWEEVDGEDDRALVVEPVDGGVVGRVEPDQEVLSLAAREAREQGLEACGRVLGCAAARSREARQRRRLGHGPSVRGGERITGSNPWRRESSPFSPSPTAAV